MSPILIHASPIYLILKVCVSLGARPAHCMSCLCVFSFRIFCIRVLLLKVLHILYSCMSCICVFSYPRSCICFLFYCMSCTCMFFTCMPNTCMFFSCMPNTCMFFTCMPNTCMFFFACPARACSFLACLLRIFFLWPHPGSLPYLRPVLLLADFAFSDLFLGVQNILVYFIDETASKLLYIFTVYGK